MALWSRNSKTEQAPQPKAAESQNSGAKPEVATVAPKELSPEDLQKRRAASAQLLLRFGEVVGVLMRTPQFRSLPLSEIGTLVVPPLMSGQFLVAEAQSKSQGFITPVATALWAKVSKEVDKRLSENLDKPIQLAPNEWTSGEIAWLIVLAGNAQSLAPMIQQLQRATLKGQPLKMRAKDKDGKAVVTTFASQDPSAAS